jgi:hypothetical protein
MKLSHVIGLGVLLGAAWYATKHKRGVVEIGEVEVLSWNPLNSGSVLREDGLRVDPTGFDTIYKP